MYELYVFTYYLQILRFVENELNKVATLEEDMVLLQSGEPGSDLPPIEFEMRMAITYRSEKKKILRSQIALVQKVIYVLRNCEDILTSADIADKSKAYTELILEQTDTEI